MKSNAAELAQRDGVWLSATKSGLKMATQIVIDYTGDTAHQFDPADGAAVAETDRRLKKLTGSGFTAAKRLNDNRGEVVRTFETAANEMLFTPRLQGG